MSRIVKLTNGADCRFFDLDNPVDARKVKHLTEEPTGYKVVKDAVTRSVKQYTTEFVNKEISENMHMLGEQQSDIMDRLESPQKEFFE